MKQFIHESGVVFATASSMCPSVDEVIKFLEQFRGKRFLNGAAGEVAFYVDGENVICDTENYVIEHAGDISEDLADQVQACFDSDEEPESNQKLPVCQMVQSERIYSPQEYVEAVTGHYFCFPKEDTVQEIQDKLDRYCVDSLWNYPMTEIDHIVESNLRVVLVDVSGFYGGNEIVPQYRWFEVPEDFREEVA